MTQEERDTILIGIANKVDKLGKDFIEFKEQTEERFTRLEERLIKIEERLTNVEERLTNVEERLTNVEERLTNVEERLTNVEEDNKGTDTMLTIICKRQEKMQKDINEIKQTYSFTLKKLKNQENRIQKNERLNEQIAEEFISYSRQIV